MNFKEWAHAIKAVARPIYTDPVLRIVDAEFIANKAADFLESLATLSDEAPAKYIKPMNIPDGCTFTSVAGYTTGLISEAYADYYQAKCAVLLGENKALSMDLENSMNEVDAAQQKIADLSDQVYVSNNDPNYKEQPKPVMLNKKQFYKLMSTISEAHRMHIDDWNENREELKNLLCGE